MDLALFDFDGTLTTRETFVDALQASTPAWRVAMGHVLLAPVVLGYRTGRVSPSALRAAATFTAFAGRRAGDVRACLRAASEELLPALVRPAMLARLHAHRDGGDRVLVVSGNYDWLLSPWCAAHGVECLASRLQVHRGRLTGRYAGRQCVGAEKAARVRAHLDMHAFTRVHAYGDTTEDDALLALAHVRTFRGQRMACAT